jgi:hypothetical protein
VLSYVAKEDSVFNTTVNEIFSSGLALSVETQDKNDKEPETTFTFVKLRFFL